MELLPVTCAIIFREDEILAVQRGEHPIYPFKWEFPGGKQDAGETLEACIVREIAEELGVQIRVTRPLDFVDVHHPTRIIRLYPFMAEIVSGSLYLHEHHDLQWGTPTALAELDWGEGDRKILEGLLRENP